MDAPSLQKMMTELAAGFLGAARLSRDAGARAAYEAASARTLDALDEFQEGARRFNARQLEQELTGRIDGVDERAEALRC